MKLAIVNTEYERTLFPEFVGSYSPEELKKWRWGGQYLFYFINDNPELGLLTPYLLSDEAKAYYLKKGVKLPHMQSEGVGKNWFGLLDDLALERKLNSKLETYRLLKEQGDLPANVHFVSSSDDVKKVISTCQKKRWVLKSPYLCGGDGFTIIKTTDDVPAVLNHEHILEPYLDRVIDLAYYYDPQTGVAFPYVSYIDPNGKYLGGRIYKNQSQLYDDLKNDDALDVFLTAVKLAEKYIEILKKYNLKQPVTLDSFIYRDENGKLQAYSLTEINYRISMGSLNQAMKKFLPDNGVGMILVQQRKTHVDWKEVLTYSPDSKVGIITMNDGNPYWDALFVSAPHLEGLLKMKKVISSL